MNIFTSRFGKRVPRKLLGLLILMGLPSPLPGQGDVAGHSSTQPRAEEPSGLPDKTIMILPVPTYPLDGNVDLLDQDFPDRFVFYDSRTIDSDTLDPETMDIILAYRTAPDAPRTIHRIKSPPRIAPEIVSTVSKNPRGGYRYRYVVTNGPRATQPIGIWLLSVPEPRARNSTESFFQTLHDEEERGPWNQSLHSLRQGVWSVRFSSLRSGVPLSSSQSAVFVVDNENRPGFVRSYFHGTASSVGPIPEDLPPEAQEQLEKITRNWGKAALWTIGPKFGKSDNSRAIASDFRSRITSMLPRRIRVTSIIWPDRAWDMYSPFIREVLTRLDEFIDRPRPWLTDGSDSARELYYSMAFDEPFPPIGVPPDPDSKVEQQLDLALKMALVHP